MSASQIQVFQIKGISITPTNCPANKHDWPIICLQMDSALILKSLPVQNLKVKNFKVTTKSLDDSSAY